MGYGVLRVWVSEPNNTINWTNWLGASLDALEPYALGSTIRYPAPGKRMHGMRLPT